MRARAVAEAVAALARDNDMVVVFGASAVSDRADVVPAAITARRRHGAARRHAGRPGNLMCSATLAGKPVLGAPGCARSPKENGFDWVLDRLIGRHRRSATTTLPAWASAGC